MKKTVLFTLLFTFLLRGVTTAQNPYESIGKEMPKGKILTLTNGKYPEIIENDTLVRIGSVMFNTITGEVVAFLEKDTLHAEYNLEPDVVSRWLSPDPLAEKYLQWSPYVYALNNPVRFIDPNGKEVIAPKVEEREAILKMINSRSQGVFAFDANGKLYLAKEEYKPGHSSYYKKELLKAIGDKKNNIEIALGNFTIPNGGYNAGQKGEYYGEGGKTYSIAAGVNGNELPTQYIFIEGVEVTGLKDTNGNELRDEPADILAHEAVGHAIPRTQGGKGKGNAIENENKVRKELKGRKDLKGEDQQRKINKGMDQGHTQ